MAISSYSTPTGGLIHLKFVKIKFSLETPTMAISLHHAYMMPKAIKIRKNKVFFRNSNHGYQLSQHAYRTPKSIKIRKNKVLFRNPNHG